MTQFNATTVTVKGALNYARARVLWREGLLRIYTVDGLQREVIANRPEKLTGYLGAWKVETAMGGVMLRSKCITCGGRRWWKIAYTPADQLWHTK